MAQRRRSSDRSPPHWSRSANNSVPRSRRPPRSQSLSRRYRMPRRPLTTQPHRRMPLTTSPPRTPTHPLPWRLLTPLHQLLIPNGLIPRPRRDGVARSMAASCALARCRVPSPPRHTVARQALTVLRLPRLDPYEQRVKSWTQKRSPCVLNAACPVTSPARPFGLRWPHLSWPRPLRICPGWPPECTMGLCGNR